MALSVVKIDEWHWSMDEVKLHRFSERGVSNFRKDSPPRD